MKKLLIIGIAATMIVANLTSCKKGDHDPFFSLKTRTARLTRKWTVSSSEDVSMHTNISNNDPSNIIVTKTVTSFDGYNEKKTYEFTINGVATTDIPVIAYGIYTEEFEFKTDGTFSKIKNGNEIMEGNWMFLGKNKDAKIKNKEALFLNYTKTTISDNSGSVTTSTYTGLQGTSEVYLIDELKSKEIILIKEYSNYQSESNNSSGKITITLKSK